MAPFAQTLRHLVAVRNLVVDADSFIGDAGLSAATDLVTLVCNKNPNITTIAFCLNSLQELKAEGNMCGLKGDEIAVAPQLRKVSKKHNKRIVSGHLAGFAEIEVGSVYVR